MKTEWILCHDFHHVFLCRSHAKASPRFLLSRVFSFCVCLLVSVCVCVYVGVCRCRCAIIVPPLLKISKTLRVPLLCPERRDGWVMNLCAMCVCVCVSFSIPSPACVLASPPPSLGICEVVSMVPWQ